MKRLLFAVTLAAVLQAAAQQDGLMPRPKPGAWDTLQVSHSAPTIGERNFGGALPIGNGRLGARLMGDPAATTLYLNDTTLWSGGPEHSEDPHRQKVLAQTRAALAAGDYRKADETVRGMQSRNNESYQPLGSLHLAFPAHEAFTAYRESLEISRAVLTVQYKAGDVTFKREIFASYPAQVIVVRLTADKPGALNFSASLDTQLHGGATRTTASEMTVTGRAPTHVDNYTKKQIVEWSEHKGTAMEEILHVAVEGGTVAAGDKALTIAGANAATLIVSAATSFNGFDRDPASDGRDPAKIAEGYLAKAVATPYPALLQAHLDDYESLFRRLWLSVNGETPNKVVLAYQWARYILIASSRPGSGAPRNEQGIWNRDLTPNYASDFTLNENPEKYYALAEPANLGETTLPLIDFVGDLAKSGERTARVDYGFHGWVAHHNADIWAMTTMATGDPAWADWPMGGIWLCENLWDRYAFGGDKAYLATKAYPVMKGAAEFALDLLVLDKNGHLVTSPSTSPENHFTDPASGLRVAVSQGSTMDMALLRELFANTIQASMILGVDPEFRKQLEDARAKMLPFQIGSQGQLQEWSVDFKEWESTHRHASHLVAVWPMAQITAAQPELFAAARRSLELRGSGGYHPDKAGMWARIGDGDKALAAIRSLTIPAMYDAPLGGVGEMLLQSQSGVIDLLPALPTTWSEGEVLGMRARGGYEVDIHWKAGKLTEATIRSASAAPPRIELTGKPLEPKDPRIHLVQVR